MAFVPDEQQPAASSRFVPDAAPEAPRGPQSRGSTAAGRERSRPSYTERVQQAFSGPSAPITQAPLGALENIASLVTGTVAPIPGLLDTALGRLGFTDPRNPESDYATARDKYVYQPRSQSGQQLAGQFGTILEPVGDVVAAGGESLGGLLGSLGASPQTQRDVSQIGPDLAMSALDLAGLRAARTAAAPRPGTPRPPTPSTEGLLQPAANAVEVARAAGFKVLPSQAERALPGSLSTTGGRAMQLLSPSGDLLLDTAKANAQNAARVAAQDLGLPAGQPLSQNALRQAMDQAGAVKDAVAQQFPRFELSPELANVIDNSPPVFLEQNPRILALRGRAASAEGGMGTADALREAQRLRDHGFANRRSETPETVDLGRAQLQMADAIENAIEDQAARSGMTDSDLMLNFRNARQQQAKIANVMEAGVQQGEEFFLDPQALAKFDAQNPNVLTGGLKVIADTARDFPDTMKLPTRVAAKPGGDLSRSNVWNLPGQLVTRTIGQGLAPIIRSDFYQNMLGRQATRMGPGGELGRFYPPPREPRPQPLPPEPPPTLTGGPDLPLEPPDALSRALAPEQGGPVRLLPDHDFPLIGEPDAPLGPPSQPHVPADSLSRALESQPQVPAAAAQFRGEPPWLPEAQAPVGGPIRLFNDQEIPFTAAPDLPLEPRNSLAQALVPEPQSRVRLPRSPDFPLTEVPPETPIAPRPAPDALSRALAPEPDAPAAARAFRGEPPWTSEPPPAPPEAPVAPAAPPRKPPGGGGAAAAAVAPESPQGRPFQVTGYRGVGPGRDPLSTEGTLGNALFWAPDEFGPTGAARYAEGGGQVLRQDLNFQNMLGDPETSTLASLAESLGVDPQAALENLIEAARGQGFDALAYNLRPGAEFVQIPPRGVTGPTSNGPR